MKRIRMSGYTLRNAKSYILIRFIVFVHCFFFFQAEDGIRDYKVTGVQTCALPILAVLLTWGSQHFDWIALRANGWQRVGLLAALMAASVLLYFGALWAAGLKLRALLRR